MARRYTEAEGILQTVLDVYPHNAAAYYILGYVRLAMGRVEEGVGVLRRAQELSMGYHSGKGTLAYGEALAGRRGESRALLDEARTKAIGEWIPPSLVAKVYGALGEYDRAFEQLEEARIQHNPNLHWAKVSPIYDPLRSDSRFSELLKKIGLD